MITTIKKKNKGERTSWRGPGNNVTGNCLQKRRGRWPGWRKPGWWSHARGTCARRPETKMAGAASERLFRRVDRLSLHSCAWRAGAEGWEGSPSGPGRTRALGRHGEESVLRAHTLGLAPSQSVTDESRVTIAARTRWGSVPCAATRPKPRALPGGPGVKTQSSNAGGVGLIPDRGTN